MNWKSGSPPKYGYGLTWRSDRFGRQSVKFQSGKEVGGFRMLSLRSVPKNEFDEKKVLELFEICRFRWVY